jgi:glutamate-5-semialdehyde dehydrogenase
MNTDPIREMGREARAASRAVAALSGRERDSLLLFLAETLENQAEALLAANAADLSAARAAGLSGGFLDRLLLNEARLLDIAADTRAVAALPNPVGEILEGRILDNGLSLLRRRVPLGVVAVIYEARPNVTVDIASLCLKTGNAVILRGGKETVHSNKLLVKLIQGVLENNDLPPAAVQAITDPDRALMSALLQLDEYVDMLIPRGSAGLHKFCRENSRIPVITGGIGLSQIYVDQSADQERALPVLTNAKIQRPSACNSMETVLIHKKIALEFIPKLIAYLGSRGVSFHPGPCALPYFPADCKYPVTALQESDLSREWLSNDLNVVVVEDLDAALEFIRAHGSGHSDSILTESMEAAERFVSEVDSAAVYVNASTRFTDGAEFGLGAEVAVSTRKLHARGPMALQALTTYKWIGYGNYTSRG